MALRPYAAAPFGSFKLAGVGVRRHLNVVVGVR